MAISMNGIPSPPVIFLPSQVINGLCLGHEVCGDTGYSELEAKKFRDAAVAAIRVAMKEFGCFQLEISNWSPYIHNVLAAQATYFEELTQEQKESQQMSSRNPNGYEGVQGANKELWRICWNTQGGRHPPSLPKSAYFRDEVATTHEEKTVFASTMRQHSENMGRICDMLMELFAEALCLPKEFFRKNSDYLDGNRLDILRLIHYFSKDRTKDADAATNLAKPSGSGGFCNVPIPGGPNKDSYRTSLRNPPHTDLGFLTIVQQFGVGGLQVENRRASYDAQGSRYRDADGDEAAWVDVPCDSGILLVQASDMLEYWTQRYWLACRHRVVEPADLDFVNRSRYSLVYFMHVPPTAQLEAIPWDNIANSNTVCKYDEPYLRKHYQTSTRFLTAQEYWLNCKPKPGSKGFLFLRIRYEEALTDDVLAQRYRDASWVPFVLEDSDVNSPRVGEMENISSSTRSTAASISSSSGSDTNSVGGKQLRAQSESTWVQKFLSFDPGNIVTFEQVRRECKEALSKFERSEELYQRVLAGTCDQVQLSYESQAMITNARDYIGNFDSYLSSLRKSSFRYAKSSARKFLTMHSSNFDGSDLELILLVPKSVLVTPQTNLVLSGGYTIPITNFEIAYAGKDSCILQEAWNDIVSMSWQMCLRQSSSPKTAYTQFVRHLAPFDRALFPNAITAGVRNKITTEWIGFFAYEYIFASVDRAEGNTATVAQCLAALGKTGTDGQRANEWHVIYQQFMVNHILTTAVIEKDVKFYVNTCTGLGSQFLVDQKVRLFVPQILQQRRVLRLEAADHCQLVGFLETLKSNSIATNKTLPNGATFALDGMRNDVDIEKNMALTEVYLEETGQDGIKRIVSISIDQVFDALLDNDFVNTFLGLRDHNPTARLDFTPVTASWYFVFQKPNAASSDQLAYAERLPSKAIMQNVWNYHEGRRIIFSNVANDLFVNCKEH
jgi:isopenicillin N synthase-like dioxygenase